MQQWVWTMSRQKWRKGVGMTEGCTYILNLKLLEHVEDISSRNFLRCLYEELGTLFLKMTSISIDQPTTAPAFPFVCQKHFWVPFMASYLDEITKDELLLPVCKISFVKYEIGGWFYDEG